LVPAYPEAALPTAPPAPAPKPAFVPAYPEAATPSATPVASATVQPGAEIRPVQAATTPSRPLPAGYQARSGVGVHPSGWPLEIFGGRDGSMMVLVPGDSFVMGRDGGDPAEAPAHQVRVSTFYIDKHEVTNRQFDQFVKESGERPERTRSMAREGGKVSLSEDSPVVMVSAKDARDYADWVGKRIPTEAQWEMAARGTDHRPYPWGPLPPVWERRREPHQIDPVMSFPSDLSPYGAYDMAGNALEWTRDWFDPKFFANSRGAIVEDPTGPSSRPSSLQVTVKGGSKNWIVSAREGMKYESRLPFLGFRCSLPVEGPDNAFQPALPAQNAPGPVRKKVVVPF
jgi:formylglycine-generating enzyme